MKTLPRIVLALAVAVSVCVMLGTLFSDPTQRPLTPRELAMEAFDCAQYGLPMRVTKWTLDGKPQAVECIRPQARPSQVRGHEA